MDRSRVVWHRQQLVEYQPGCYAPYEVHACRVRAPLCRGFQQKDVTMNSRGSLGPMMQNDGPLLCSYAGASTVNEGLEALRGWRWQAVEPVQPVRRLTFFQRLYAWLYDYNRY